MAPRKTSNASSSGSQNVEFWLRSEAVAALAEQMGRIADAFEWLCKIESERLEREYPPKPERRPATVNTAKYPNPAFDQPEKATEQDDLSEGLGPREKALLEKARLQKSKSRSTPTPGNII